MSQLLFFEFLAGKGGTLVLVGQDGVQWPPILFPPGGHLLSFLTCLENGLEPFGHLDPPLWSQKGKVCKKVPMDFCINLCISAK